MDMYSSKKNSLAHSMASHGKGGKGLMGHDDGNSHMLSHPSASPHISIHVQHPSHGTDSGLHLGEAGDHSNATAAPHLGLSGYGAHVNGAHMVQHETPDHSFPTGTVHSDSGDHLGGTGHPAAPHLAGNTKGGFPQDKFGVLRIDRKASKEGSAKEEASESKKEESAEIKASKKKGSRSINPYFKS